MLRSAPTVADLVGRKSALGQQDAASSTNKVRDAIYPAPTQGHRHPAPASPATHRPTQVLADIQKRVSTALEEYEGLEFQDRFQALRRDFEAELTLTELAKAGRARVGVVLDALADASTERKEVLGELKGMIADQQASGGDAERDARKQGEEADALLDGLDESAVLDRIEAVETLHQRAHDQGEGVLDELKTANLALRPLQSRLKMERQEAASQRAELQDELSMAREHHALLEGSVEAKEMELIGLKAELQLAHAVVKGGVKGGDGSGGDGGGCKKGGGKGGRRRASDGGVETRDGACSPTPPTPLLFEHALPSAEDFEQALDGAKKLLVLVVEQLKGGLGAPARSEWTSWRGHGRSPPSVSQAASEGLGLPPLRTREERPSTSDPTERPRPSRQRPPK